MTLQLHSDSAGLCHYLNRMPVHQGDVIEAFIGGSWIAVTYEWSRNVDDVAYGFFEGGDVCVSLKSYVDLRWPLAN